MTRNPKCNTTRGKTWERKAAEYLRSLGMDAAHTCVRGKSAPDVIVQTAAGPCPIEVKSERMHCAGGALRRHLDKARKHGTPFVMWQPARGIWAITFEAHGRLETVCPPHAALMEYGAGAAQSLVEYLMLPECGGCGPNRHGLSTHYESRQHPPAHLECWRDRPPAATLDDQTGGA